MFIYIYFPVDKYLNKEIDEEIVVCCDSTWFSSYMVINIVICLSLYHFNGSSFDMQYD